MSNVLKPDLTSIQSASRAPGSHQPYVRIASRPGRRKVIETRTRALFILLSTCHPSSSKHPRLYLHHPPLEHTTPSLTSRPATTMSSPKRARRTAASAARDAISTAARLQSAALLHDAHDADETPGRRRGLSKKVSYAEVPIDADDFAEEEEEEPRSGFGRSSGPEDEGEEDVVMDGEREGDVGDAVEVGASTSLVSRRSGNLINLVISKHLIRRSHPPREPRQTPRPW
jgi:hypothetical protein